MEKSFSDFEKRIIKRMISYDRQPENGWPFLTITKMLKDELPDAIGIYIEGKGPDEIDKDAVLPCYDKLYISSNKEENIHREYNKILKKIIYFNELIDYLLNNGYLIKEEFGWAYGLYLHGHPDNSEIESHKSEIYKKPKIISFLQKAHYQYFITEQLQELALNNYKFKHEVTEITNRKLSLAGLVIALISLIISALPNFKTDTPKQEHKTPLKQHVSDYHNDKIKTSPLSSQDTLRVIK